MSRLKFEQFLVFVNLKQISQIGAHRVILAASSPFFKKVLKKVSHNHPLIYLKGVKFASLEAVLSFVYCGEVSLAEADLEDWR